MSVSSVQNHSSVPVPSSQNCIRSIHERIKNVVSAIFAFIRHYVFCCCFAREITPPPAASTAPPTPIAPEVPSAEELQRRAESERASLAIWNRQILTRFSALYGIDPQHVNLASETEPAFSGRCMPMNARGAFPHTGHYSPDYRFAENWLLIKLPAGQLSAFPEPIRQRFADVPAQNLELMFMVQCDEQMIRELRGVPGGNRRNLPFHMMAFPNLREGQSIHQQHAMGVFSLRGAQPERRGHGDMPVDGFRRESIYPHPVGERMGLSPDNARILIDPNADYSSFYVASELPGNRACACFTLLLHNENGSAAQNIGSAMLGGCAYRFKMCLQEGTLDPELLGQINSLLTFQRTYTEEPTE